MRPIAAASTHTTITASTHANSIAATAIKHTATAFISTATTTTADTKTKGKNLVRLKIWKILKLSGTKSKHTMPARVVKRTYQKGFKNSSWY